MIGKLNSSKHWPTTAEERALIAREEKERLKKALKITAKMENQGQRKVSSNLRVNAKEEEDLDEEKIQMITKTLNRVRITQVINKR